VSKLTFFILFLAQISRPAPLYSKPERQKKPFALRVHSFFTLLIRFFSRKMKKKRPFWKKNDLKVWSSSTGHGLVA